MKFLTQLIQWIKSFFNKPNKPINHTQVNSLYPTKVFLTKSPIPIKPKTRSQLAYQKRYNARDYVRQSKHAYYLKYKSLLYERKKAQRAKAKLEKEQAKLLDNN